MRMTIVTALLLLIAACQTAPAIAQQPPAPAAQPTYYLFTYRPGPAWRADAPMAQQDLRPHGAYMRQLQEQGALVAGGGFLDRDGGMAIVRADDITAARALLAADPAIVSGVFTADCAAWRPRFGGVEPPR